MCLNKLKVFFAHVCFVFTLFSCTPKNQDQEPITQDIPTKLDLVVAPQSPSHYTENGTITITATLTPQVIGVAPSGLVAFMLDDKQICGEGIHLSSLNGALQAVCEISMKEIITVDHTISAQYMGEPGYQKSTQQSVNYAIMQLPTKIDSFDIQNSPNNNFGSFMILTATMRQELKNPDFEGVVRFKNETTNQILCDAKSSKNADVYTFKCDKDVQILPEKFRANTNNISAQYLDGNYFADSAQQKRDVDIAKLPLLFKGLNGEQKATVTCEKQSSIEDCVEEQNITISGQIVFGALDKEKSETVPAITPQWMQGTGQCSWQSKTLKSSNSYSSIFKCDYKSKTGDAGDNRCFRISYPEDNTHKAGSSDTQNDYACIKIIPPGHGQVNIDITNGDKQYTLTDKITISGRITHGEKTPLNQDKLKLYLYLNNTDDAHESAPCTITDDQFQCNYTPQSGDFTKYNKKFSMVYMGDNIYEKTEKNLQSVKINQIIPTMTSSIDPKATIVKLGDKIQITGNIQGLVPNFPLSPGNKDNIYFYLNGNRITTCNAYSFTEKGEFSCEYLITANDLIERGTKPLDFSVQFIGGENYQTTPGQTASGSDTGCPTGNIEIISNANVSANGFAITLTNDTHAQENGFILEFSNVCPNITCEQVKIISPEFDSGLIKKNMVFLPNEKQAQYTCAIKQAQDGTNIVTLASAQPLQEGFRPWVDKFNITIGDNPKFETSVQTPDISDKQLLTRSTPMYLNQNFNGCGLKGTVLQRVFDCSKKVKNYAVRVDQIFDTHDAQPNADGTSSFYTLFDPNNQPLQDTADTFWFLVACPAGNGGKVLQQQCHWLTPVIQDDNPAFDQSSEGAPTFQAHMLTGYQKRMLLSGRLLSTFSWPEANGNAFDVKKESYIANETNPGTTPALARDPLINPTVCTAKTGESLFGGKAFAQNDANIRDMVSTSSGTSVTWQIPSYPMLVLLSGGTPVVASVSTSFGVQHKIVKGCVDQEKYRPYCNISNLSDAKQAGFGAINVPGFIDSSSNLAKPESDFFLISSSSDETSYSMAWAYQIFDYRSAIDFTNSNDVKGGIIKTSSIMVDQYNPQKMQVRCVGLSWY